MMEMNISRPSYQGRYGRIVATGISAAMIAGALLLMAADSENSIFGKVGALSERAAMALNRPVAPTQELADGATPLAQSSENYDKKVKVRLYMESRCPACKRFVSDIAADVVQAPGMNDIMDFKLVPFGNGEVGNLSKHMFASMRTSR
jgi:hypothetical protein